MNDSSPGGFDTAATVARPRYDATTVPDTTFVISVIEGPDSGLTFTIDAARPSSVLIGQGPACEIRLSDREVSRRHASLEVIGRRLRILDLASTNGTYVDGLGVNDGWLVGDELVRVGRTALRVEAGASAAAPTVTGEGAFGKVVGASLEMRRLYTLCERMAASDVPVIIEGETGTGKEVLAEALHEQGPRAQGPFVVFDCTAVPPNLLEAELFGHERGAFTGAVGARKGVFEQAHGGTLLIDEIGDLDLNLQPKLLRAIERCEVRRIGGDRPIKVDVRLIAATRRDLDKAVQAGRFRDDLFHRLAVGRVELPPLRKRQGDVPVLVRHFCKQLGAARSQVPDDVVVGWEEYAWPGNVRELRNAVARYLALGEASHLQRATVLEPVDPEPFPASEAAQAPAGDLIEQVIAQALPLPVARQRVVEEFERRYIERVLAEHGGNVARAANASGIARRYFQILKARKRT
ncbi:MAG: sigma 54-dependent Fis family transcriptional regulator [Deltaproteobacteria bacterium]|nr:sigma 54-dependent Fis family transcriptional regulator [Deltaproteobacteria bacterium]